MPYIELSSLTVRGWGELARASKANNQPIISALDFTLKFKTSDSCMRTKLIFLTRYV